MSGFSFNFRIDEAIKFSNTFWKSVGSWIVNKIRADAGQGVFQTDQPHKKTYSKDYADLKENRMKKAVGTIQSGKNKGKVKREKMEQYKGVSIASTNTSFVDMTLTGQTLRGLHVKDSTVSSVTLSFRPEDVKKIVGNQRPGLNRRLVGLNRKNQEHVHKLVKAEIARQLKKSIAGKTTINIKL